MEQVTESDGGDSPGSLSFPINRYLLTGKNNHRIVLLNI